MKSAKKRVLVVDDDVDFTRLVRFILESHDYQVEVTHRIQEAYQKIQSKPDLVLLDRKLHDEDGVTDGLTICRKIRDDKDLSHIPIIIISGSGMPMDRAEGLNFGADDYITKPFHEEELLARVTAVLRRSVRDANSDAKYLEVLSELKRVISSKSVTTLFQPIFSLSDLSIVGCEALSRPRDTTVLNNTDLLFKAALNFGFYFDLEMVCWDRAIGLWQKHGLGKLFLNCHPYLVESSNFHEDLLIKKEGIVSSETVLELTEREDVTDYKVFTAKLARFSNLGFLIAIDDVGHGFSSLETLVRLKPSFVKIDISLVRGVDGDPLKQNLVEAISFFCKKSGILSIAEGIETNEEFKKIKEIGVDYGQGYFLAKPTDKMNFTELKDGLIHKVRS